MNILAVDTSLNHNALCIYLSGCRGQCGGCHNPETWDFNAGAPWREWVEQIISHVESPLIHKIWIMGGEPLDQDEEELLSFLFHLWRLHKPLWLWTRREFNEIDKTVLSFFEFVKTGPYRKDLAPCVCEGITLASNNQRIVRV